MLWSQSVLEMIGDLDVQVVYCCHTQRSKSCTLPIPVIGACSKEGQIMAHLSCMYVHVLSCMLYVCVRARACVLQMPVNVRSLNGSSDKQTFSSGPLSQGSTLM